MSAIECPCPWYDCVVCLTHLPNKLLCRLRNILVREVKLSGDPLCFILKAHAAFCFRVKGPEIAVVLVLGAGTKGIGLLPEEKEILNRRGFADVKR